MREGAHHSLIVMPNDLLPCVWICIEERDDVPVKLVVVEMPFVLRAPGGLRRQREMELNSNISDDARGDCRDIGQCCVATPSSGDSGSRCRTATPDENELCRLEDIQRTSKSARDSSTYPYHEIAFEDAIQQSLSVVMI